MALGGVLDLKDRNFMDLTYLNTLPRWLRWALALITLIAYALVFVPLYHRIGDTVFILSLLPVLLTGLLLGLWGGLLSAISVFAIIILSLNGLGLANQDLVVPALSLVVLIVVAAAVGRLQDQRERARKQLLERQRAAEALRESEQKYRTLFEASSDAIFVETLDGDVLDCNAAACEMFGYTKEEMFGLNVVDLIPPATAETLPDVIEEHARTGGVFVEAINKRKDGRLFPVEVSTRLVTIDGIERVIVYVQDITERKQAEEALRASEARYSDLYENANDIIFTVDLAGNFTSANRVAYTALGYGPEAVTDHNLFEVLTPESTEVALELLHQAVEQGRDLSEQQPWELEATRKDGAVRLFEVRTRLIWEDEQVVGFQGIARDITERRRAEERLRKRERLLQGLAQVSQELLRARDVDAALPLALRYLGHATGASRAYLAVNHPGPDGTLSFSWRHEWHAPHIDARAAAWQGISYAGQGLQRWMAAFGRERRIAEPVDNLPASERAALAAQGARSTLMLPLFVSDGWWGFVGLEACDRPRRWQPLEIEMVRTVAGSISSAVERERSQNQYQILSDAAAVLTSTLDLEQVLDRILDQVGRMVPSDTANVMMIEGDEARIVRWRGYEEFGAEDYISSVRFSVSGLENLRQMVEHRKPTIIPDTQESEDWVAVSGLEWLRSYASAPVSVQGEVVGFLNVDSSIPGFFSLAEAYRLQVFADYAAIAIQNARLFQSEQRQTRRLALLADVARIVATTLDMEEMLQAVPEAIHRYFGYPSVMVFLPDEIDGAWVLRGYGGIFTGPPEIDAPGEYRQPVDVGIVGYVARTGESYLTADVRDDPYHYAPEGVAVRSEVCVPIRDEDQLIGVIDVESERLADFDERDRSLLEAVADTVAVGLRNARLFEEARHRAEELAVALAQLEELDRLKDELIQNVSHELRSPLALIRGYAEMLQIGELGRLTPEQQTPVDIIVRRAHMLGDLVQDITLILEAEASRPEPESVRLDALARAAMEDFQIVAAEAQVTLRAEIPDHLPAVQHNTTYLRRVLDNLLGNAVKFTAEGGEIDVRVRQGEDEVVLEVSDTGIGIAPDQLGRVFERFYQVDGSARRRYGGVGLGLSLVKDLVEAYEGTVSVESEVGRGTTFAIRLPLSKSRRASRSPES
jgi:PAS domain S-box-containing protein